MQLIMLLDAWKAAQMRLTRLQGKPTDSAPDVIDRAFQEEAECRQLFYLTLKTAYLDAAKLRQSNEQHDILAAPMPDLEFWRQVCEREIYEARLAAGEPVMFYDGRCCLYGSVCDYDIGRDCGIIPGPYPGLQYYARDNEVFSRDEQYSWRIARVERVENQRTQNTPIPINKSERFETPEVARKRLARDYGIIGPATYAEVTYGDPYPQHYDFQLRYH